ncbi:MAG: SDR family NAD-dependent epimerase/dehydratase, partial [Alphaproteobacteria bacterium]|nr:SDR family NAD-dependent epimerase/dehydratase [Alphaproteobacteria bacterium]
KAGMTAKDGALEIYQRLEAGTLDKTTETITLDWYQNLSTWHRVIKEVELHGGILEIESGADSAAAA